MINQKTPSPLATIVVLLVAFVIIYKVYEIDWLINLSILMGVTAVFSSKFTNFIHRLWMSLARVLSLIVPKIILTLVFYLFLFPLSLLSKLFRGNNILRLKKDSKSFWTNHKRSFSKEYFEKPW